MNDFNPTYHWNLLIEESPEIRSLLALRKYINIFNKYWPFIYKGKKDLCGSLYHDSKMSENYICLELRDSAAKYICDFAN